MNPPPPPPPTPRRSPVVLIVGIALAVILFITAGLGVLAWWVYGEVQQRMAQKQQAETKLEKLREHTAEAAREAMEGEDGPVGSADLLEEMTLKLGETAEGMAPGDRAVLLAGQAVLATLQPSLRAYETAYSRLVEAGTHSAVGLTSKEQIAERREVVRAFGAANEKLASKFASTQEVFRTELGNRSITGRNLEEAVAGFIKSAQVADVAKIREQDRELTAQMLAMLDLYESTLGQWTVDAEGNIIFEDDASVERYNEIQGAIEKLGADQAALQQKILERQIELSEGAGKRP